MSTSETSTERAPPAVSIQKVGGPPGGSSAAQEHLIGVPGAPASRPDHVGQRLSRVRFPHAPVVTRGAKALPLGVNYDVRSALRVVDAQWPEEDVAHLAKRLAEAAKRLASGRTATLDRGKTARRSP